MLRDLTYVNHITLDAVFGAGRETASAKETLPFGSVDPEMLSPGGYPLIHLAQVYYISGELSSPLRDNRHDNQGPRAGHRLY